MPRAAHTNGHKDGPFRNVGFADLATVGLTRKPRQHRTGGWRCNG